MLARIIKDVDIVMTVWWTQEAWKGVSGVTIKICFKKCGTVKNDNFMELEEEELTKFEELVQELSSDISVTVHVTFDAHIPVSKPMINENKINWWQKAPNYYINTINIITNNVWEEIQEISEFFDDDVTVSKEKSSVVQNLLNV